MTINITPEYLYLGVTLILMLIQVLQIRRASKLKREIEELWGQISIIAMSTAAMLEKLEKKIDGKQDK